VTSRIPHERRRALLVAAHHAWSAIASLAQALAPTPRRVLQSTLVRVHVHLRAESDDFAANDRIVHAAAANDTAPN
jgi:hypothetical protein